MTILSGITSSIGILSTASCTVFLWSIVTGVVLGSRAAPPQTDLNLRRNRSITTISKRKKNKKNCAENSSLGRHAEQFSAQNKLKILHSLFANGRKTRCSIFLSFSMILLSSICFIFGPFIPEKMAYKNACSSQAIILLFAGNLAIAQTFLYCLHAYFQTTNSDSGRHFRAYELITNVSFLAISIISGSFYQHHSNFAKVGEMVCFVDISAPTSDLFTTIFIYIDVATCLFTIIASMSLLLAIYLHVRKTNLKHIYTFRQSIQLPSTFQQCSTNQPNNDIDSSNHSATSSSIRKFADSFARITNLNISPTISSPSRKMTKSERKRIRSIHKTRNQSILHALILFVVYFPPFLAFVLSCINPSKATPTWLLVILSILTPSQGILTLLLFTRPNILVVRERFPETSRIKALWQVIKAGNKIPPQYYIRSSRSKRRLGIHSDRSSLYTRRSSLGEVSSPIPNPLIKTDVVCPNHDSTIHASNIREDENSANSTRLHGLEVESEEHILFEKKNVSIKPSTRNEYRIFGK
ncbi:predicted protein [Chaetoceros tenuissimus]|uniref:Uncharacterized protein n=1 Tax=Chaetoceros tenuissimus TaxID=426638 RepID=A0AAD3CG26_9STRA|nr:predicted protein [Chaetoceros tenuissimus]